MEAPQRPARIRRNRMDGPSFQRTIRFSAAIDHRITEEMATDEFKNNRSAVVEQAMIEFFNRRDDVRAA